MVSIIIAVHNGFEYTRACLKSILENTAEGKYEVIVVDNGSKPKYRGAAVRNEENLGFPRAVNQGIKASKGGLICLLNNDVIVTPGWVERLARHLRRGYDLVGPCTNSVSGPQQVLVDVYNGTEELGRVAEDFYMRNKGQAIPYHRLVGFCLLIKRKVFNGIGLFDEAYSPGNFEDDDFCLRAIEAGFRPGIARDIFVHHFGGVTHRLLGLDYAALVEKNRKIFETKWGKKYERLQKRGCQAH